jgi:hypothetical protein
VADDDVRESNPYFLLRSFVARWRESNDPNDWDDVVVELRALVEVEVPDEDLAKETGLTVDEVRRATGRDST